MKVIKVENKPKFQIGVIGDSILRSKEQYNLAYEIGREIALSGSILICGGRGGVMAAAVKGVKDAKGISVGILPTDINDMEVSSDLTITIPTFLHWGRNHLIPLASDGVIACGGNTGTLSELAYCDLYKRPLVCLTSVPGWSKEIGIKGSFRIPSIKKGVLTAQTGGEAVRKLLKVLSSSK
ncbi:MAG: TIGR00725 family protein [Candidatus Hodarchaeales archaeon]|jgi:uncharacterized protein (TIGR00725 family)